MELAAFFKAPDPFFPLLRVAPQQSRAQLGGGTILADRKQVHEVTVREVTQLLFFDVIRGENFE